MIAPSLILDSQEKWLPVAVDTIITAGAKIDGEPVETLEQLELTESEVDRIDFPKDMFDTGVGRAVLIDSNPPTGYHQVIPAGGLWWHQYWTFWLYNPKKYAGFGEHEGDWEMVQLGCIDEEGDYPILMTCSQHDGGEKREYWRVALHQVFGSPLVYVARDSHANYFEPHKDVTDTADGKGISLVMQWRPFGTWQAWKGKWGNSDNSPGPLTTRRAWNAPHAYHSQARG